MSPYIWFSENFGFEINHCGEILRCRENMWFFSYIHVAFLKFISESPFDCIWCFTWAHSCDFGCPKVKIEAAFLVYFNKAKGESVAKMEGIDRKKRWEAKDFAEWINGIEVDLVTSEFASVNSIN